MPNEVVIKNKITGQEALVEPNQIFSTDWQVVDSLKNIQIKTARAIAFEKYLNTLKLSKCSKCKRNGVYLYF